MKRIILFENRPERQKVYLPGGDDDIRALKEFDCLQIYTPEHDKLIASNNLDFLKDFDLLIFHRSYLIEFKAGSMLNAIIIFCKQYNKDVIFFSGGVNSSFYSQENHFSYQSLTINAKEFYANFLNFIFGYSKTEEETCLLKLKYGENWEIMYMLQLRDLLTMEFQDSNNELDFSDRFDYLSDLLNDSVDLEDKGKLINQLSKKINLSLQ